MIVTGSIDAPRTRENIRAAIAEYFVGEKQEIEDTDIDALTDSYLNFKNFEHLHEFGFIQDVNEVVAGDEDYPFTFGDHLRYLYQTLFIRWDRYIPEKHEIDFANSETIIVKVGGRPFETYIDRHGVQRFRVNTVLNHLCNLMMKNMTVDGKPYGLNEMNMEFFEGKFSNNDWLTWYTSFGYSVSGFMDISHFDHLDIENPLWDKE
jgi:hypothetical protein